jgi:putative membrane protein (TIGR04086 family)
MQNESLSNVFQIVKATLFAVVAALLLTIAFAVVIYLCEFGDKILLPVNVCIRVLSIFIGCFFALRGEMGWLRGGIVGVLFTFVSGVLFSAIGSVSGFSWWLVLEVAFGFVAGALAGIFAVNVKQ